LIPPFAKDRKGLSDSLEILLDGPFFLFALPTVSAKEEVLLHGHFFEELPPLRNLSNSKFDDLTGR
jgi:hypothetical protein